jgi:hypothetical protein
MGASTSDVIGNALDPLVASAMRAAIERAVGFDPVTDHLATAMSTNRSKFLDGALKAVEHVPVTSGNDLE